VAGAVALVALAAAPAVMLDESCPSCHALASALGSPAGGQLPSAAGALGIRRGVGK